MPMTSIEADKRAGTQPAKPVAMPCKVNKNAGHSQSTKTVKSK